MDHTFFGLTHRPFPTTPDTDHCYPASSHEAVIHGMSAALINRESAVLVDGQPGTGKTLTTLRFLSLLADDVPTVFIPAPRFSRPADFFQAILFDLGIPYHGLTEHELRLAVADRMLSGLANGDPPIVIVIDEAHHLSSDLLEEVRLLGNLESRVAKAAFVVLCGLPALRSNLAKPESIGLSQRIATRFTVEPLGVEEATAYIRHNLESAGGDPDKLLTAEATDLLVAHCQGVPRLLNQAAAMAFALCEAGGERTVDAEPVLEALTRLGLSDETDPTDPAQEEAQVSPRTAKSRKRRAA